MEGNKWGNMVVNFVIRAILGMGLIYFINQYHNTLSSICQPAFLN